MDKWLNQLFMLLKSPVGEAEIPDVKPPLSVVDSQELGFFFTYKVEGDSIYFVRIGTHSDLFK
jgi:hypothetical protein